MNLSTYFEPINIAKDAGFVHNDFSPRIGDAVSAYTETQSFPEIAGSHLAIVGVNEDRASVENSGCGNAPNAIRSKLYHLSIPEYGMKLVDLGNIMPGKTVEDTYFALAEVVAELLHHNILPIILGGSQDLTFAMYKAYEKLGQIINMCSVDSRFDLGNDEEPLHSQSYLSKIIVSQPNYLFNYTNIGYQSYFVDKQFVKLMEDLHFDTYRLGTIQSNISDAEPLVRNADMLTVDISSVRQSDAPGNRNASPHGFYGEELCAVCRFAGMSDKLSSIGFFEVNPFTDNYSQTSHLVAHAIWYFIEGFYARKSDFPNKDVQNYRRYIVPFVENEQMELVFYKSKKSDRWWMELPCPEEQESKYQRHLLLPCLYRDYEQALEGEIPDRWWSFYQRLAE